jgi:hypothetical protein
MRGTHHRPCVQHQAYDLVTSQIGRLAHIKFQQLVNVRDTWPRRMSAFDSSHCTMMVHSTSQVVVCMFGVVNSTLPRWQCSASMASGIFRTGSPGKHRIMSLSLSRSLAVLVVQWLGADFKQARFSPKSMYTNTYRPAMKVLDENRQLYPLTWG